jgi:hypothetical protein
MARTFQEHGWDDREVKVRRNDLLTELRKNREQHIRDYKEACEGYREQAIRRIDEIAADLRKKIHDLKEGQTIAIMNVVFGLNAPVSHEKSYDQIIKMVEMSVDDEIVLTAGQFACFVMDDWEWKAEWTGSMAQYRNKNR